MSYGCSADYADVINNDDVEKLAILLAKDEWKTLKLSIDELGISLSDVAKATQYNDDDIEELDEEQSKLIIDLLNKFADKIQEKCGIKIWLSYHSLDDNGDRYDDIDGLYWLVTNGYIKSPQHEAVNKLGITIEKKFFVTCG